jgi:hypothetical protein
MREAVVALITSYEEDKAKLHRDLNEGNSALRIDVSMPVQANMFATVPLQPLVGRH